MNICLLFTCTGVLMWVRVYESLLIGMHPPSLSVLWRVCSGVFSQAEWSEASGFSLSLAVAGFFFLFFSPPPSLLQYVNYHSLLFFLLVQEQVLMCVYLHLLKHK